MTTNGVDPRRPVRPESKRIEKKAVRIVLQILEEKLNWSCHPSNPSEDLGIDYFVTVCQKEGPTTATDFLVQVRGTKKPQLSDGSVNHAIDMKHVLYWRERSLPVLYLLVDVTTENVYWLWVKDYLAHAGYPRTGRSASKRVPLKIPVGNLLTVNSGPSLALQAGRMVWPLVHKTLRSPLELSHEEAKARFPFRLQDLPHPFVDSKRGDLDCLVVSGPTRYDLEKMKHRFAKSINGFVDKVLGTEIVLGESAYNLALAGQIIAALASRATRRSSQQPASDVSILPYVCVTQSELAQHNLILLPCGDVNPILTHTLIDFEMMNLVRCPVHHEPYHSSERIRWEVTGDVLEKEREDQAAGYILLLPNPWNSKKAVLVCGGNRGVGTQAALLRLLEAFRGSRPLVNRRGFPGSVVRADFSEETLRVTAAIDYAPKEKRP